MVTFKATAIFLVLCGLCTLLPVVTAERTSIPIEDLKVYQLIELWDTIPGEQISPSGDVVRSYRDVTSEYTRQNAYIVSSSFADLQPFTSNRHTQAIVATADAQTFKGIDTALQIWSVQFTNKKFPKYAVERARLDIVIPQVIDAPSQLYTLVYLPVAEQDIILHSSAAQIFDSPTGSVVIYRGDNISSTLVIKKGLTRNDIDSIAIVSFYVTSPPPAPAIEPQIQAPIIIPSLPEQQRNNLGIILFSILPLPLLGLGGVWIYRKRRMHDLMLKYGAPRGEQKLSDDIKKSHSLFDGFHHLLERYRKR